MSLSAYVDESGEFHDGNGFICLCAWLGDHHGWENFNKAWNHLLAKSILPGIHMNKFYSQCRLRGINENAANDLLSPFIEAIRDNTLAGFSIGVDGRYLRQKCITAGHQLIEPQLFAVHRLLKAMREYCTAWAARPDVPPWIAIVFDEDETYSLGIYRTISRLRKIFPEVKELIAAISFADDEVYAPLQASDILANLTTRYMRDRMAAQDGELPEPPILLRQLTTPFSSGLGVIYGEELWDNKRIDLYWSEIAAGKPL
ncbi:MAG: DUF3800 domain-containing protein [Candidatus Binataceae bacterium]